MSTDYEAWRGKVDLAIQNLNRIVGEIQGDMALLKTSVSGFSLSQEAVAGAQQNILNELSELREKTSASIGLDGITNELRGIKDALYSQSGAALPPARTPIPPTHGTEITGSGMAPRRPAASPPTRISPKTGPMPVDEDTADVDWRIKGNKEARDTDPFAYAFVFTNRDQVEVRNSVRSLVSLCEQYGTVKTADGYLVKLGGTNNSLLNRSIPKK